MDPLSQGVIGAALSMSVARKSELKPAFLVGWLAGMAPDLDILIRSSTDPLLAIEFHRHFTHSLLMAPVIGALVAIALHYLTLGWKARQGVSLGLYIVFGILGTLTHGLLDACTSYGTQLLWPFSNMRVAWNNVGIVDPIPTFGSLALIIWATLRKAPKIANGGFIFFVAYLCLGVVQRERAESMLIKIAQSRGHTPTRWSTKPTIFNNIVFRSMYEHQGQYFIDAVRIPFFGQNEYRAGDVVAVFDWKREFEKLPMGSPQRNDLQRFAWFSDDYLTQMPDGMISDARYSMVPQSSRPMWGIYLNPAVPDKHVTFWSGRSLDPELRSQFFSFLFSGNDGEKP